MVRYEKIKVGFIVDRKVRNLRELRKYVEKWRIDKVKSINGENINLFAMKGTTKEKLLNLIYDIIEQRIIDSIKRGSIKNVKFKPFYNIKYKIISTFIEAEINVNLERLVREIIRKAQEIYKKKDYMIDAISDLLWRYFNIDIPDSELEFFKYYNIDDIKFILHGRKFKILSVFF